MDNSSKPHLIRNLGIGIMAVSGFILFSNSMSLILVVVASSIDKTPVDALLVKIGIATISTGLLMLTSGIFIYRQKNWARYLMQLVCIILFVGVWTLFTSEIMSSPFQFFETYKYFVASVLSVALLLFIVFFRPRW